MPVQPRLRGRRRYGPKAYGPAPSRMNGALRIASYNIRKAVGLDWRRDPERIMAVLGEIDADIIALQEVDRRFGRRRAALGPDLIEDEQGFADVALNPESVGWHGNTIIVRGADADILESRRLALPMLEPRGAVLADIRIKGQRLRVVGVHLALLKRYRLRQLEELRDQLAAETTPTLIMGDFNEWSPDLSLEGYTAAAPGRSFHASFPVAPLDRILTCPALRVSACGVHRSELAKVASDHLPIWADILFKSSEMRARP